jgi:hypothetical protein
MERERDTTGVVFKLFGGALILAAAIWFLTPYLERKSASASTSTSTAAYAQSP